MRVSAHGRSYSESVLLGVAIPDLADDTHELSPSSVGVLCIRSAVRKRSRGVTHDTPHLARWSGSSSVSVELSLSLSPASQVGT